MDFDLVQPIQFVIIILKVFGLWPLTSDWESIYRIYLYTLHFLTTFLTTASMWASVFTAQDLEHFSGALYMALTEVALVAKVLNILKLSKEIVHFFELVEGKDLQLKNAKEIKIFENAHRVFYIVVKFYLTACMVIVGIVFTMVAFRPKWVLPYPAWMPFDLHSEYFWYAYGFQFIGITVTCLSNASIDLLQSYFLHHISSIYQVIGLRLARIGSDLDEVDGSLKVNKLVLKDVKEIIKVHLVVKRITIKCERLLSFPIFVQILLSALVLCFTAYQFIILSPVNNPGQFLAMMDYFIVMGLQIFLPCYFANQVTVQSGMLSEALYNCNWVVLPQKSKGLIYLFMEFLKEPVYIKSGKFFNNGLTIFSKTINNAYSCFAVLIRIKK